MFKTVKFNIFEENLQGIVYRRIYQNNSGGKIASRKPFPTEIDVPIPQPAPDFWRPDFISQFINYKPVKAR